MNGVSTHLAKPGGAQVDRFREKARGLGVDEDEAAFDEKPAASAGQKPKPKKDEAPGE